MTYKTDKDEAAIAELEAKISAAKQNYGSEPRRNASGGLLTLAYRLTIEMIAAIGVSGFIGWWIDKVFDTKPLFMIVLLFLGMAAGVMNAVRTAGTLSQKVQDAEKKRDEKDGLSTED